ncbi:MAG: hypothetical protein JXR65_09110 [Bacteroidales bacterium]|nr:hypothetical protein [Bacteroidales bacterium]
MNSTTRKIQRILQPYTVLVVALIIITFSSCKNQGRKNNDIPLARVDGKYLYESDLKGIFPKGISSKDSLVLTHNYIEKWVHTQLLLEQAEKNLPEDQLHFQKQLEEYRNSLITYAYENEYVKQNIDTTVTEKEIEDYYNSHLKDFELKENIVKIVYVILNKKKDNFLKQEKTFRKMFNLPDSVLLDSLEKYAPGRSLSFSSDTNNWIPFNDVVKVFPIETYNQEFYLKNHRIISLAGENKAYLIKFVNFKIKDENSPLELESGFIRSIIINQRKKALIYQLRKDIFEQASKQKLFEIY